MVETDTHLVGDVPCQIAEHPEHLAHHPVNLLVLRGAGICMMQWQQTETATRRPTRAATKGVVHSPRQTKRRTLVSLDH